MEIMAWPTVSRLARPTMIPVPYAAHCTMGVLWMLSIVFPDMKAVAPSWTKMPFPAIPVLHGTFTGPDTVKPERLAVMEPVIVTIFRYPKESGAIVAGARIVGDPDPVRVRDFDITTCSW